MSTRAAITAAIKITMATAIAATMMVEARRQNGGVSSCGMYPGAAPHSLTMCWSSGRITAGAVGSKQMYSK